MRQCNAYEDCDVDFFLWLYQDEEETNESTDTDTVVPAVAAGQ